jgi:hypothetical protein
MSNTTETSDLSASSLVESYKPVTPNIPEVCQPGDKECVARWVQAFSDCD